MLVHRSEQTNPYFIILDEVEGNAGDQVNVYLHPANESAVSTVTNATEYEAIIDHHPTKSGSMLSFFYGTPPNSISIEKVPSAVPDRYPGYPKHNRLESVYDLDTQGNLDVVTILFPHDAAHPKPNISRIAENSYSGCSIDHGLGIKDLVIESSEDLELTHEATTFQGKAIFSRISATSSISYFVRHGVKFVHDGTGFESDVPITAYVKGKKGVLISDGANITFSGKGLGAVNFTPAVTIVRSGADFIEVQVPAGEIRFSGS
jgi:hypothetical protein